MDYQTYIDTVAGDVTGIEDVDLAQALRVAGDALRLVTEPTHPGELGRPSDQQVERVLAAALGLGVREFRRLEPTERGEAVRQTTEMFRRMQIDTASALFGLALSDVGQLVREARAKRFKSLVEAALQNGVASRSDCELISTTSIRYGSSSRRFDYVVKCNGEARLAVVVNYASWSGGRQKSDLDELPSLSKGLASRDVLLLAAVDGPAIRRMSGTVKRISQQLEYLANAALLDAVIDEALDAAVRVRPGNLSGDAGKTDASLDVVTLGLLRSGRTVTADFLAIPEERAATYFARYAAKHSELDLVTTSRELRSSASETLAMLQQSDGQSLTGPRADALIRGLAEHLGRQVSEGRLHHGLVAYGLNLEEPRLRLPEPLPLLVRLTRSYGPEFIEAADEALGEGALVARTGIIIDTLDPEFTRREALRMAELQRSQFAVLDAPRLRQILLHTPERARELLLDVMLSQVDLRIVSPFVPDGPTPASMFFGRERELRRIGEGISRQSFALVGGRKVGKTSLLRRVQERFATRWPIAYVDCQAHTSREDFIEHLAQLGGASGNAGIRGAEASLRAFARAQFGDGHGILLMDEVDELFWEDATSDEFPHIVSSALRSLSQLRELSIIATGERQLFELTKRADSPHWNFCTPLLVGPLDQSDASKLLTDPLERLRVKLSEEALSLALDRTACHPNLVQYLGDRVVSTLAQRASSAGEVLVDEHAMDELTMAPSYRERFTTTFWSRATALEKLISVSSSAPLTPQQWLEQLNGRGLELDFSAIRAALDYLQLYGVLDESRSGLSWASASFETYLGAMDDALVTDEWIREIRSASH